MTHLPSCLPLQQCTSAYGFLTLSYLMILIVLDGPVPEAGPSGHARAFFAVRERGEDPLVS